MPETNRPLDASAGLIDQAPEQTQPYLRLSRLDRPIGIWLLLIPCWLGLAFARIPKGFEWSDLLYAVLFAVGAIAMRGAGCTYNDILDKDLDAGVARTAGRPIPAGQVTTTKAWLWLGAQIAVGFLVWLTLPMDAKILALLSIPLVAAYPLMKRITWWPQAWLGLTLNFGFLIAFATASHIPGPAAILAYLGLAIWTLGYDTIYALQDVEDDAMVGVKSTARLFGDNVVPALIVLATLSALLITAGNLLQGAGNWGLLAAMAFLAHLIWQAITLRNSGEKEALRLFKSNREAGLILLVGLMIAVFLSG